MTKPMIAEIALGSAVVAVMFGWYWALAALVIWCSVYSVFPSLRGQK